MGLEYDLTDDVLAYGTVGDVEYRDGAVVLQEGLAAAEQSWSESGRRVHLLFDIRHSSERRSADEIRSIAAMIAPWRRCLSGRCAVVVGSPVYYGLGRMFLSYLNFDESDSAVFYAKDAAVRWLVAGETEPQADSAS